MNIISQVDGSIFIHFNGSSKALEKRNSFMEKNLYKFPSFSDYLVEYDKKNKKLNLDLCVNEKDILNFLGFVAANVSEVGFSGKTWLSFVGSGGKYYAK
ncbi:MAG TPA: hypothetical protein IAB62_05160 [Candidatus Coprocola pullicola]|nr:hypothetical protein [Candidatus Coprocola pullicola]